jgi:hypothetical protein
MIDGSAAESARSLGLPPEALGTDLVDERHPGIRPAR